MSYLFYHIMTLYKNEFPTVPITEHHQHHQHSKRKFKNIKGVSFKIELRYSSDTNPKTVSEGYKAEIKLRLHLWIRGDANDKKDLGVFVFPEVLTKKLIPVDLVYNPPSPHFFFRRWIRQKIYFQCCFIGNVFDPESSESS